MLECTGVGLVAQEGDNSDKKWELKLKQALDEQLQVPRRKQFTGKPPHTWILAKQAPPEENSSEPGARNGTMVSANAASTCWATPVCIYAEWLLLGVLQKNHTDLQLRCPDHCSAPDEHKVHIKVHMQWDKKAKQRNVSILT